MIALLLFCLFSLCDASSHPPADDTAGKWKALQDNGAPCIMLNAQIDLTLSYIDDEDDYVEKVHLTVPANSHDDKSTCLEHTPVGDALIDSQVLQLDFPDVRILIFDLWPIDIAQNEGWNVRIYFTQDNEHLHVTVTANYSSMQDLFPGANKVHKYYSVIDFADPPEIANDEYAKIGDSIYCPTTPQGFTINDDTHNGPYAQITFSKFQMQAYLLGSDQFGNKYTCAEDQVEIDLVPVIISAVLAALVLFTLVTYFIYRSRLPTDILEMTEPEFEEDDEHHHHQGSNHNHQEHSNNQNHNHHDNYGYKEEHDHRL